MRARLIRPEFWSDATVGKLPARTRLTYIGLWNVADDAGFFEWRMDDIGAALFSFESAGQRERHLAADIGRLVEAGRVRQLACGVHGLIPTLKEWRIQGGSLNERTKAAHEHEVHTSTAEVRRGTHKYRSESLSESESVSPSPSVPDTADALEDWRKLGESLPRGSA